MRKEILERYSCRRKKDFITFFAVALFLLIISFECYLMFWLPIQFRKQNAMARHVACQRLVEMVDYLRNVSRPRSRDNLDSLQESEMELIRSSLDILAIYVREHQENLTDSQISELQKLLDRTNIIVTGWRQNRHFHIKRDKFDPEPVLRSFEKHLNELNKKNPVR